MARWFSDAKLQHSDSLLSAYVRVLTFRHIFLTVCLLSSFAEKASSKSGEISDGVLWDREVEQCLLGIAIA